MKDTSQLLGRGFESSYFGGHSHWTAVSIILQLFAVLATVNDTLASNHLIHLSIHKILALYVYSSTEKSSCQKIRQNGPEQKMVRNEWQPTSAASKEARKLADLGQITG